ncbi:MAG: diacylglycerol/lipid kinase family protein [Bacillota bacterium]
MKIKIIYNPKAGKKKGIKKIEALSQKLLDSGHILKRVSTKKELDAKIETKKGVQNQFDLIIAAGGDGTINEAASALAENNSKIPLGIFQFGTVNDFANHIKITNDPEKYVKLVNKMNTISIDLGKIDDKYFINVAAGGILTNVAHDTPRELKAVLGKNAYYIHGLKDITEKGIYSTNLTIKTPSEKITDDFYLFLISNSPSVGGFSKLAPDAEIQDGLLNCVFVKKSNIFDSIEIFIQILKGKHIQNENVLYFKSSEIEIINNSKKKVEYDIDGEYGGHLPIKIKAIPSIINILI